ncbi:MAG: hypothetical protein K2P58_08505 [Hyphomonadaceae bacterium]|nr:hypothetical protein [Hyphomonadaceae bacterium]
MSSGKNAFWREPGALMWVIGVAVGVLWLIGASAAALVLLGPSGFSHATALELGATLAAIVLPSMMAVFSGLAARDSASARAEARRLADAADRLLNPERAAEDAARQLAMTVRGEIGTLDRALEATLARLQEVEGRVNHQARLVDDMAHQAKAGANHMIAGMEREREELLRISQDLTKHAQTIGNSISRHTQAISEAARQAEMEVRAADQALDNRLTSFGAAAALISDRTSHLTSAAQASADSALRLEQALTNALDVLAKATSLTDAARQSAEAASLAANSTAGAVRESTDIAIENAKRAADLIRNEALGIEREAASAMDRLRDAAESARTAAFEARTAIEEEVAPAVRRRSRPPEPQRDEYDASWRRGDASDPLESTPAPRRIRREPPPPRDDAGNGNGWTWRDLLSSVDNEADDGARRESADAPAKRRAASNGSRVETALPVAAVITRAGLELDEVFSPSALERIAQRARSGSQARRRAVQDAAPIATRDLSMHLAADANDNDEALQFLRSEGARIAELIARGRASMNAEATRVFLLLDAAAS